MKVESGNERILVVAAHPDDEVLGCGGTMARHRGNGDEVATVFLADGVGARIGASRAEDLKVRQTAGNAAARVLGTAIPVYLEFPDNRLDTVPLIEIIQVIERLAIDFRPTIIYTHHAGDLNVDHRICHQAVLTAFRPTPRQSVHSIYGFEVPSSTEWMFGNSSQTFHPTRFVDIFAQMTTKLEALACYEMEMREFPHPRSARAVEALATWRGASIGCHAAEAFMTIRQFI